jgi:DNA-binding transcriptional LysR family regulator
VGTLRVAAFQTAVMALMPQTLLELGRRHPDLRVEVTEREPDAAVPALVAGDFDLVIAEEYPDQSLLQLAETERANLLRDPLWMVTPAAWPERSIGELRGRPFVFEPPQSPAGRWAVNVCRRAGFEPDVRYTTTDLQIHLRLVEEQLAVALLPELSGFRQRTSVSTHRLPGRPARQIVSFVRRGAASHPAIRALIDALPR